MVRVQMDGTLGYLREALSNYYEQSEVCRRVYEKIESKSYESELEFVRELDEEEHVFLNKTLKREIEYAEDGMDPTRYRQLNEVYELLI